MFSKHLLGGRVTGWAAQVGFFPQNGPDISLYQSPVWEVISWGNIQTFIEGNLSWHVHSRTLFPVVAPPLVEAQWRQLRFLILAESFPIASFSPLPPLQVWSGRLLSHSGLALTMVHYGEIIACILGSVIGL